MGITLAPPSIPVGAIMAFAMSTPPDDWLECDGSAISRTTYAALFAIIGTTYGAGDGSTTFNLPDLRGEFIRGWDNGKGTDTGRAFGSAQQDAFQGHKTSFDYANATTTTGAYADRINRATTDHSSPSSGAIGDQQLVSDGTNGTPRIASETRPTNISLMYCIFSG